MSHTPGPWHTHDEMVHAKFQIEGQEFHYAVANALEHSRVNQPTMKANARLIAASPDLLEACKARTLLLFEGPEAVCEKYDLPWHHSTLWMKDANERDAKDEVAEDYVGNLEFAAIKKAEKP